MNNNVKQQLKGAKLAGVAYSVMICAYIVISLIGQVLLEALNIKQSTIYYIVNSTFSIIAMLGVGIYINLTTSKHISLFKGYKKFHPKYALFAVMFFIGMLLGFGFVNGLIADLIERVGGKYQSISLPLDSLINLILFSIFFAVIPAFTEEFFFRGFSHENLDKCSPIKVALTVALAFSIYHGSLVQLVYQFIFALGLSFLAIHSGSLIPCFIAHFLNNVLVLIIEYFKIPLNLHNPIVILIGLLFLVAFVVVMSIDKNKTYRDNGQRQENVNTFWIPYGIFGAVICVMLIILGLVV